MLVVLLGIMALAVDIGFAFTARSEAQRVSDASSLAGASIFLEEDGLDAVPEAKRRAKEFAARNAVRGEIVDTTLVSSDSFFNDDGFEVFQDITQGMTVQVIPGEAKVRVWVFRDGLGTWFARVLGRNQIDVQAMSAAEVDDAGTSEQCILPMAIPDIWDDLDDDLNGNNIPDDGEDWLFEPGDDYRPWDGQFCENCDNGTGYGSNLRDNTGTDDDIGTIIWIKAGPKGQSDSDTGGTDDMVAPGNFQLWSMPDPEQGCGASRTGGGVPWAEENILTCNTCPISVGEGYEYDTETGNKAAIKEELQELMDMDPNAEWDPETKTIINSAYEDPFESPRVRIVPFWSPDQASELNGTSPITFNNFGRIFLEGGGTDPPGFAVYARFIGTVAGGPEGPATGPLVKYLRLVE